MFCVLQEVHGFVKGAVEHNGKHYLVVGSGFNDLPSAQEAAKKLWATTNPEAVVGHFSSLPGQERRLLSVISPKKGSWDWESV